MRTATAFILFLFLTLPTLAAEPMLLAPSDEPLRVATGGGEVRFVIEVADDADERARGLMFRDEMDDDRGMLFVFDDSRQVGFWMQNTPMPLDLLFVGEDGRIRAIEQGTPFSTDTIAPRVRAQFVLELKAGTAQKAGIEIGDRLYHPLVDAVAGGK